jgi:hypothetical protein
LPPKTFKFIYLHINDDYKLYSSAVLREKTMNTLKSPSGIANLMRKHELTIAGLYTAYSNKFPEYKDFWSGLANEEFEHAELISTIEEVVKKNPNDFIVDRFPESAILHSIEYINEQKERAFMSSVTLKNALSEAMYLEQALIENKYFEIFEGGQRSDKTYFGYSGRQHQRTLPENPQILAGIKIFRQLIQGLNAVQPN